MSKIPNKDEVYGLHVTTAGPDVYEIVRLIVTQINYVMHELHGWLPWEMLLEVSCLK